MNVLDLPNAIDRRTLTRKIGHDLVGPVLHRWLLALDQHIGFFEGEDVRFLYCARAGVRIRRLYAQYLVGLGRRIDDDRHRMLWVSRLAICKGVYKRDPGRSLQTIASEYYHAPMRDLVRGLLRNDPRLAEFEPQLAAPDFDPTGATFPRWIGESHPLRKELEHYLSESSRAFDSYLTKTIGTGGGRAILIDSGWQGTTQSLLSRSYPDYEWHGLYVGRILTDGHDRGIVDAVIGLLFQAQDFDPAHPETAITLHRHLFETLLEPNGPSVEEILGGPLNTQARAQIAANESEKVSSEHDALYLFAENYLSENMGLGPAEILARYRTAIADLARILSQPTREEALALSCKDRSADFGKSFKVPVLIEPVEGDGKTDDRIRAALWTQGQIALEYDGPTRVDLQRRASGLSNAAQYFDPAGQETSVKAAVRAQPTVAVITRTKNRPLLLRRAAESIARQTYENLLWVVVNDGGDEEAVTQVIEACSIDRRRVRLVSHEKSLGMEAASNAGIRSIESDYIVIHDDDDSLHPDFLAKTVDYLESTAGQRYGGVVTGTEYVSEEIRGDQIIEHGRMPYMDWVRNVQLSEMLVGNFFAPIAFVYRRAVYDAIGGYNEALPVLGDWYFNLEFLARADIKALPDKLAYYHHRDRGVSSRQGIYSNSVIGGQDKHEEFASVCRNMFIRQYGKDSPLAAAAVAAYFAADIRGRLSALERAFGAARPQPVPTGNLAEVDRLWLATCLRTVRAGYPFTCRMPALRPDAPFATMRGLAIRLNLPIPVHPSFDEVSYLRQYPDVEGAVSAGKMTSGYQHYIMYGSAEGRTRPMR
ncbi:glycosyltransferase family 2 protein [Paenirhodobacter populi]|nr:glycosyltransferase family A protein [Sinirhodobacter populi]